MTILVQQQLREAAREIANWSGSLTDTWVSSQASYMWIVGCIDEDDQKYPVVRIEADAYGHQGESEKLAEFMRLANPKSVLALLDELDQLKAENAELLAALQQAQMALTGYVPAHRNDITSAAIERAQAAIDQAMTKEQP